MSKLNEILPDIEREENIIEYEYKWFWMMEYCRLNYLPSAQDWAWEKAKERYNKICE